MPLVDAGRIDIALVDRRLRRQQRGHLLVRQLGRIVEHVVVEHVVAHGQQVHPVARLGHLQQPALVHVLVVEPEHGPVDDRPVALQKRQVAAVVIVEKVAQDEPQVGVDGAGIFRADVAACPG